MVWCGQQGKELGTEGDSVNSEAETESPWKNSGEGLLSRVAGRNRQDRPVAGLTARLKA